MKDFLTWPMVITLLGGGACFTLIAIFAPNFDMKVGLVGLNGLLWTMYGILQRSPIDTAVQRRSLRPGPPDEPNQ